MFIVRYLSTQHIIMHEINYNSRTSYVSNYFYTVVGLFDRMLTLPLSDSYVSRDTKFRTVVRSGTFLTSM